MQCTYINVSVYRMPVLLRVTDAGPRLEYAVALSAWLRFSRDPIGWSFQLYPRLSVAWISRCKWSECALRLPSRHHPPLIKMTPPSSDSGPASSSMSFRLSRRHCVLLSPSGPWRRVVGSSIFLHSIYLHLRIYIYSLTHSFTHSYFHSLTHSCVYLYIHTLLFFLFFCFYFYFFSPEAACLPLILWGVV